MNNFEILKSIDNELKYLKSKRDYYKYAVASIDNNLKSELDITERSIKNLESEKKDFLSNVEKDISPYINKIINDDCRNHLLNIPENSIHLFLSDIPYGINLDEWDVLHNNTNSALLGSSPAQEGKSGFKRRGKPINGWNEDDKNINREYQMWVYNWATEIFPIMKEGASVFVFSARRTIANAIVAFEEAGFLTRDILVWEKEQAHDRRQDILHVILNRGNKYRISKELIDFLSTYIDRDIINSDYGMEFEKSSLLLTYLKEMVSEKIISKYKLDILHKSICDDEIISQIKEWEGWKIGNLSPIYEPIAWFFKPYSTVTLTDCILKNKVGGINIAECLVNGKSPTNILRFGFNEEEKNNKLHEAQKPIELMKYLIKLTTKEGQIVLDPFAGSGTTAMASKELKRDFIAFEADSIHYKNANDRLNHYVEKPNDSKWIGVFNMKL